jgi:IS1 family transposase
MQQPHLLSTVRICFELILVWLLWQQLLVWEQGDIAALFKVQRPQKRQRHPHSPLECPACQEAHGQCAIAEPRLVEAWSTRKSQRGRPKTVETDGHCCPNEDCPYYNITDGQVHALVGYGKHYGADTIQYLRCQACQTKVTTRWNTPMYDLKTPARRVAEVMTATSEGVDVAAASRIFDHDERTIQRWLGHTAEHSQRLHHHFFHDLVCQHLQLDELVTKRRGVKERVFVWVALDAHTKIMPVIHIGTRKRDDAQRFVHELWQRLAPGAPPVFTTAGLWLYYYALTAHFGQWVPHEGKRWPVDPRLLYGQVHKVKVGYKLKAMYTLAVCGTRQQLRQALGGLRLTGRIMTSYVERVNLTLREHIAPLSRRPWSLARDERSLWLHIEWGRAYYHFCRYHEALRLPTLHPQRYRSRTPAMAAGLARRRWCVSELLLTPLPLA